MQDFPECTVVWCARQEAQQYFAELVAANKKTEGGRGLPGIALWRVGAPVDLQEASIPKARLGWYSDGNLENGNFHAVTTVPVRCEYEMTVWCVNATEQNNIERRLAFLWQYWPLIFRLGKRPILSTVPTQPELDALAAWEAMQEFKCPMWLSDSVYSYVPAEKSGKVLWYGMDKQVSVITHWIGTREDPWINEISVVYKEMTDGNPVNDLDLNVQLIERPAP